MKALLTLFLALGIVILQAQNFEWAKRLGGTAADAAYAVATDATGNVYTTGVFNGTVDFDEGPGETILTSAGYSDIFISRHDASGNLVWVKQIGGDKEDIANDIAIDGSGNVLTTGSFRDTVDFDPGPGITILAIDLLYYGPTGTPYLKGSDLFISKLDPDGNFIYAKQIGGNLSDYGSGIAIDGDGNVYTTGEYSVHYAADSADFDPGPGVYNLGNGGGFIVKLDAEGDFSWAKRFGYATSSSSACGSVCTYQEEYSSNFESVAVDQTGNVFTTGSFISINNDFDPGAAVFNMHAIGARDAFICKLTDAGNFVWVKQFGGSGATAKGDDIAVDASGNACATGSYFGKVDFNPGSGTAYLTSTSPQGIPDIFISKLTSSGNYSWAKSVGGTGYDLGASIALDAQSNVYYTGYFNGKVDFDPGSPKYNLTAVGYDCFISKLTGTGAFGWARQLGGPGDDRGNALTIDGNNNVLTAGSFSNTVDFDPNAGTYNLTAAGVNDGFVHKLNQAVLLHPAVPELTLATEIDFQVYPNPAASFVSLSLLSAETPYAIKLIDPTGQSVRQYDGNFFHGANTVQLSLENLPTGIYLLALQTDFLERTVMLVVQ